MSFLETSVAQAIAAASRAHALDDILGHIPIEVLQPHRLIGALVKIEAVILTVPPAGKNFARHDTKRGGTERSPRGRNVGNQRHRRIGGRFEGFRRSPAG